MIQAAYLVEVNPASHELKVELRLEGIDPNRPLLLATPTWVPGAYGFMKYGRDVFDVKAKDSSGKSLSILRQDWAGYTIAHPSASLIVTHTSYAYDTAWGELAGLVDHQYAVLLATRLLHPVEHRGPLSVEYRLPKGWKLHHPGQTAGGPRFAYPSFQKLLDTPVVAGSFDLRTRDIDGVKFHHVFLDRTLGFDAEVEGLMARLTKVSRACREVFGAFPFKEYSWIFSFSPGAHWGLEHADGTMIALGQDTFIDADERNKALRVCAHELLHAWNVCRLKPAPLEKADLMGGSFPDALWVAEGFTRYYEFLLGVRSGEAAPETFLSNVVNYLRTMSSHPAYERVSAADSSRASFLNHNRYPGSVNNTIDYYDKGMLIAFDVDATLRLAGKTDLDREMRAFYESAVGKGEGYTSAEIIAFFLKRNPELASILPKEVDEPGSLSTVTQLEKLGFEVKTSAVAKLGMVLEENKGPKITNLVDTLPAGNSGLAPGDEITRLDGFPYSFKGLTWAIKNQKDLTLSITRGHRDLTFSVPVGKQQEITEVIWKGSADQLARLQTWLGQPKVALKIGEAISLKSHENFHSIQTVV